MKENTLFVSIIVPARNVAAYLPVAIQSVLDQTHSHWELIIIENNCTDNTGEIIQRYTDPRIVHIQTEQTGLSHARNLGLDRARGEFICFLDADDRLPPNSLKDRLDLFLRDDQLQFADGEVVIYDHYLTRILRTWTPHFQGVPDKEMLLLSPRCFAGITWMIRRTAIGDHRFDTTWTHLEDRVFFLSIASQGKYDYCKNAVYHIRRRPGSLMTQHGALEKAFVRFMQMAARSEHYDSATAHAEQRKFHRIFFRTYLKHLRPYKALKHYLQFLFTYIR